MQFSINTIAAISALVLPTLAHPTLYTVNDINPRSGVAGQYQQCGGLGWTGPTVCQTGWSCYALSEYYSNCHAGNNGPSGLGAVSITSSISSALKTAQAAAAKAAAATKAKAAATAAAAKAKASQAAIAARNKAQQEAAAKAWAAHLEAEFKKARPCLTKSDC